MPEESGNVKFTSGAEIQSLLDRLERERVPAGARMQCRVCWHVYDPAEGCPEESIPPGTDFRDLPDTFICPDCGQMKSSFIEITDEEK